MRIIAPLFVIASLLVIINVQQAIAKPVFKVIVTVDWEGYSLDAENIEAMQLFRQRYPKIPMVQLLNPVYFLRDTVNVAQVQELIQSTLRPIDIQGLHIHAWQSLVQYCGLTYQSSPTFAKHEGCRAGKDCGYTVSLENAYSQQALTKLIGCSQQLMVENGFQKPSYFRAGGWQYGPRLKQALINNAFKWDSSEIDADLLTTRWHVDSALVQMLKKLHPDSTPLDQPYAVNAQLAEYPNNAALADYTTTEDLMRLFNKLLKADKQVMVLGFHQETAVDYLPRLASAIPRMQAIAKRQGVQLVWATE